MPTSWIIMLPLSVMSQYSGRIYCILKDQKCSGMKSWCLGKFGRPGIPGCSAPPNIPLLFFCQCSELFECRLFYPTAKIRRNQNGPIPVIGAHSNTNHQIFQTDTRNPTVRAISATNSQFFQKATRNLAARIFSVQNSDIMAAPNHL